MDPTTKGDIRQLNSFLRGELSAVESYQECLQGIDASPLRDELLDLLHSHQRRVAVLQRRIRQLGGRPDVGSGPWGTMVRTLERGAKLLGPRAAIAVLREGEGHGRQDYTRDITKLSPQEQEFVRARILPEQVRSMASLHRLREHA